MIRISLIAATLCFGFHTQAISEQSANIDYLPIIEEIADGGPYTEGSMCAIFAIAKAKNAPDASAHYERLSVGFLEVAVNHGGFIENEITDFRTEVEASLDELVTEFEGDEDVAQYWTDCLEFAAQYPETQDLIK
jgi:hypothetical protein